MPSITQLVNTLSADYPNFVFVPSDTEFRWSPSEQTIYYTTEDHAPIYVLHELSHALLSHAEYTSDIELVAMERDAWSMTKKTLGPSYHVAIDEEIIETAMDTYREWLHARSRCPSCNATGLETKKSTYSCLACHTRWTTNEARICRLRRTKLT